MTYRLPVPLALALALFLLPACSSVDELRDRLPELDEAVTAPAGPGCETLDFETIPGATAAEGLAVRDQYERALGMTFRLEGGGAPTLAAVGRPTAAFEASAGPDTPDAGQGVGRFFLTDDGDLSGDEAPPLVVAFASPVQQAAGVLLDVDGDERFTIEARDASGAVVDRVVIADGDEGTGDGAATLWAIARPVPDVASIRIAGERPRGRFGLGFDNFTTCAPSRVPR